MFKASRSHATTSSLIVLLACISSGCTLLGWNDDPKIVRVVEDASHPVVEIITVWEPAEGHGLDGLPCRGFAGQIIFFAVGAEAPAEIGGDVSIYVFDDHGTLEEQQRPLHIFEFPNEAWRAFQRKATFGTTYQLFIPYTRRTSEEAKCNLRVRYTSPEGRVTFSKQVEIPLPGTPRMTEPASQDGLQNDQMGETSSAAAGDLSGEVTHAAHVAPADCIDQCAPAAQPQSLPNTYTSQISLPPAQLASHQMAALDHLVQSLEDAPPTTSETFVPSDPQPDAAEPNEPATPATRHRLHPLADMASDD